MSASPSRILPAILILLAATLVRGQVVPLPQELACRPLLEKKKSPSLAPSTPVAVTVKPLAAVALGVPVAESRALQPLAVVPAVQ